MQFKKNKEAKELFDKYVTTYKASKELWYSFLKLRLDESGGKDEEEILDLFKKALSSVKENVCLSIITV